MKKISFLFFFYILFISHQGHANPVIQDLIDGCTEAVNIYSKDDEKKIYAALVTSLTEAHKAGFCRGVLITYQQAFRHNCHINRWLEQAEVIAGFHYEDIKFYTFTDILEMSCAP